MYMKSLPVLPETSNQPSLIFSTEQALPGDPMCLYCRITRLSVVQFES
jgi:hypothetical protein